ncbi:MAG: hypothetical protein HY426_04190 [Candidatus Levybacteria bacterium]|nr:hypothetical protein [Candidatus Levybacteria bacterium]
MPRPVELPPLRRYPRGLDLVRDISLLSPEDQSGLRYEEQCFGLVTQRLANNEVAIGPYLLDRAFGADPYNLHARPDAMRFNLDHGTLVLNQLLEFKRKKTNGWIALKEKVESFPNLLDLLRLDPELFPGLLRDASGGQVDIWRIIIPPNFRIKLKVMTSHDHLKKEEPLPFPAKFEQVIPIPYVLQAK